MNTELFKSMSQSIIEGDLEGSQALARQSIEEGIDPLEAINQGFVPGIDHVGKQFGAGEMFIPELVVAGEAMKAVLALLEPEMAKSGAKRDVLGKVVLCTVEGDIHDIGKTLVGTMLSANGFEVFDMGVDVAIDAIIQKALEVEADIIGLSALLTTTMVNQGKVIEKLAAAGQREQFKVLVGGAPVTKSWTEEIGADGYSEDAIGAVNAAKQIMNVERSAA